MRAVNVRDKVRSQSRQYRTAQRLTHHLRSEIGTANTDVHDVRNLAPREPSPRAVAHAIGEAPHVIKLTLHERRNVGAVNRVMAWRTGGITQCHMQHRAIFRAVDVTARHHRIALFRNATLCRQRSEQGHCFGCDAVLRVIEHYTGGL